MFAEREAWKQQLVKSAARIEELSQKQAAAEQELAQLRTLVAELKERDTLVKTAMQIVENQATEPPMTWNELIEIGTKYTTIDKAAAAAGVRTQMPTMGKVANRYSGMPTSAEDRMIYETLKIQGEVE